MCRYEDRLKSRKAYDDRLLWNWFFLNLVWSVNAYFRGAALVELDIVQPADENAAFYKFVVPEKQ